jgi:hypothetical protein
LAIIVKAVSKIKRGAKKSWFFLRLFIILKQFPQMLSFIPVPFGITVIKKVFVLGVDGAALVGVFDRAPVLLAFGRQSPKHML